jgi:hypothetical protein
MRIKGEIIMSKKKFTAEKIICKLGEADVLQSNGKCKANEKF